MVQINHNISGLTQLRFISTWKPLLTGSWPSTQSSKTAAMGRGTMEIEHWLLKAAS